MRDLIRRRLSEDPVLGADVQPKSGNIIVSVDGQRIGWLVVSGHGFLALNLDAEGDRGYQGILLDAISDVFISLAESE